MLNTEKIAKLKSEIEELEKQDKKFLDQTPNQQLACELHRMFCHLDHAHVCDWHYETGWVNSNTAHEKYLRKAQTVTAFCKLNSVSMDDAIKLLQKIAE